MVASNVAVCMSCPQAYITGTSLPSVSNEEIYRNPSLKMLKIAIVRSRRQKEGGEINIDEDQKSDNVTNIARRLSTQFSLQNMFSFFLNLVGLSTSQRTSAVL